MIRLIAPYVAGAALSALVGAVLWIMILQGDKRELAAEVARQAHEIATQKWIAEHNALAREVEAAHHAREAKRTAARIAAVERLLTEDFANADTPVDPRIADLLDCLRRAEGDDGDRCAGGSEASTGAGADQ
jgi:uncharacterized protein YcbK (DUF882 family)